MGQIFKKEQRQTLVLGVVNQIREAILDFRLKPGDRLIEANLAEEMEISRNTIREAIRYLEKEGLVGNIPFKGAFVKEFTLKDLEEVYTLRIALETLAIRTFIKNLNDEKVNRLKEVIQDMRHFAYNNDKREYYVKDLLFHRMICELSEHGLLLEYWLNLENQTKVLIALADRPYFKNDPIRSYESHFQIYNAIKEGNVERAVDAMIKSIEEGFYLITGKKNLTS